MHVQVFVPIALKPHPMLQSVVQGAPVLARELVQLASLDDPVIDDPPPEPLAGVPPVPEPPAPPEVASPPAPAVVATPPVVEVPVVEEVPVGLFALVVEAVEPPPEPLTPDPLLPLSVLLEQPEGAQR
jgi:hypothetical protein